jgi:S-DNA-T family DNA segregation ATPase FtsK/SpoIIIE
MYDDPKNQRQDLLAVNIGLDGHVILYGAPGTGKTTFLQTLIYSLVKSYSPELLNLYLLDFGGRTMGYYNELPHTGGVIFSDEADKLDKLFRMLTKELENRKRKFAEYGVGSLQSYMQISGRKEPAMVMIIDNYSAFTELYPDSENTIVTLSREGGNYGIYMIFTAANTNSVKYRVSQNFKLMYTLQLNDKYEYATAVGQTDGLEPEIVKGRGLAKLDTVLEYQTAIAGTSVNEGERVSELREMFKQMKEKWTGRRAKAIPFVPDELTVDLMLDNEDGKMLLDQELIPIGYDINEAEIVSIDISKSFTYSVVGFDQAGKTNFLKMLLRFIKSRYNWKVYVVDNGQGDFRRFCTKYGADDYICETEAFDNFINPLVKEMQSRHKDLKEFRQNENTQSEYEYMRKYERIVVLIDDFDSFFKMISDNSLSYLENLVSGGSGLEVYFIFTGNPDKLGTFASQPLYSSVFTGKNGILLGGSMDSQNVFSLNMPYQQRSCQYDTGMGYLIEKNDYTVIKTPIALRNS